MTGCTTCGVKLAHNNRSGVCKAHAKRRYESQAQARMRQKFGDLRKAEAERMRAAILRELELAAAAGLPCPTNRAMAAIAKCAVGHPRETIKRLAEEGVIEVIAPTPRRQIRIVRTGWQTAPIVPPTGKPVFRPTPAVREIIRIASEKSGRPIPDIMGRSRFSEHVRVRQAVCLLAFERKWSKCHIARVLGRDHSTVHHSIEVCGEYIKRDHELRRLVEAVRAEIAA